MTAQSGPGQIAQLARLWHVDILVADDFVPTELAGIVDVLSISNRVCVRPMFSWSYRSLKGGLVGARGGMLVETEAVPPRPDADYLFVVGNTYPENPALSVGKQVDLYVHRRAQVFLLAEAAARFIDERGEAYGPATTHWENNKVLRERRGRHDAGAALAVENGPVVTCAGMGATVDVALAVVGRHISSAAKMTVADIMLHERIRDFSTLQPFSGVKGTRTGDRELDDCIETMCANIEEPLPIQDLADLLGISSRSLERKFRTYLNTTPNVYYRELRMSQANNLLLNTTMSVYEIGLACGFGSGFSGLYKAQFGVTPLTMRRARRR